MNSNLQSVLEKSVFYVNSKEITSDGIPWHPHPQFKGVFMKDIITGKDTDNRMSCHYVLLEPDSVISEHAHSTQYEIHDVLCGSGKSVVQGFQVRYNSKITANIPEGTLHEVRASHEGLLLKCTFFPALK